jgi:recombinational DNA repair protein (RecF pathway)
MAESILQGFLIKKIDYRIFDEIITILDKNGNRINCISLGSKKINSKNSRNLFIGSFNEFIIFRSSSEKRLSKLKKTTTIKIFD